MEREKIIDKVLGLRKLFTPYTSRLTFRPSRFTFRSSRFTVHASRSLLRFTPYALLFTVFVLLFALCSLPSAAFAADKLVVKDSGGETKFVVTDTGQVDIGNTVPVQ